MSAILALPLVIAAPVPAQCQYEVAAIILGPPCDTSGHAPLIGRGMNNNAEVVGYWQGCFGPTTRAFFWSEKTGLITLPTPPGVSDTRANDINDAGLICGDHLLPGIGWRAFVYDITTHPGEYTYLEPLHGVGSSWGNAINNNGVVAGARSISKRGTNPYNAVIWDTTTGEVTDLGVMLGPNSSALGINNSGAAVGWTGTSSASLTSDSFYWDGRIETVLGVVPEGQSSFARDVNNHGDIVGYGFLDVPFPPDSRGFVWNDGYEALIDPFPGYVASAAMRINDARQVVGLCSVYDGSLPQRAYLWQHGVTRDLNSLLIDPPGALGNLTSGQAVNDFGVLVARGTMSGDVVAVLLSPTGMPIGDLDFNCRVDVHDLQLLLDQWTKQARTGSDSSNGTPEQ